MRKLSIDIETYCEIDILSAGAYRYAEESEIILFGYSVDDGQVQCIDMSDWLQQVSEWDYHITDILPPHILKALTDPDVIKTAHNAPFEISNISNYFGIKLDPSQWRCSAVLSANAGYPLSLDGASQAIGTVQKKDKEGKDLIRYFCVPCKPTKANGGRTRNLPEHAPEKWAKFIDYCKQDVATERDISDTLSWVNIPQSEQNLWQLDQIINSAGVKVDIRLAKNAIEMDERFRKRLTEEAKSITGLSNPNSPVQLKDWLSAVEGVPVTGLTKDTVKAMLKTFRNKNARRILEIRKEMAKTSVKKYMAIINAVGLYDRIRGLIQFYGANRTGRWAGRLVQVQNLPTIDYDSAVLDAIRQLVLEGNDELLELIYGPIPAQLSQLIRTCFIPEDGHRFIVIDYSAIEARVIAWLANEQWRLDVFKGDGKIYEASAAAMFKVPVESIDKGSPLRKKGKVAELACGYQGGINALIKMGGEEMGLTEEEMRDIIAAWRKASPNIVKLWHGLENAAKEAIRTGMLIKYGDKGIAFKMKRGTLHFLLPSGRCLRYPKAALELAEIKIPEKVKITVNGEIVEKTIYNRKTVEKITFWATNQTTKQWEKSDTYGGKLTENLVQAAARDCLANGMMNLHGAGYKIVMHVHDEVVLEMPKGVGSLKEATSLMCRLAPWMKGLPLTADGFEADYYKKEE